MPETFCEATQKIQYPSRNKAMKSRRQFRSKFKRPNSHGELEAFKCNACGLWHLGRHMMGRRRRSTT